MDMEQLVDAVTKAIMRKLSDDGPKVVAFGDIPDGLLCENALLRPGTTCADVKDCDYIIMTAECFRAIHGGGSVQAAAPAAPCAESGGQIIDLTVKRLIHERDLRDHNTRGGDVVKVAKNAIITALAHDYAKGIGAKIIKG